MRGLTVVEFVIVLAIVAIIALAIVGEVQWYNYAKEHNCRRTGNQQEEMYWTTYCDSNNNCSSHPSFTTHYEYACDNDKVLWH